MIVIRDILLFI